MIICPRLTARRSWSGLWSGLRLGSIDGLSGLSGLNGLSGLLDLDPLLRGGQVIRGVLIPLAVCNRIGSVISSVGVRNDSHCLIGCFMDVSIGEGFVSSGVNFGQTSVNDGGVGLDMLDLGGHSLLLTRWE